MEALLTLFIIVFILGVISAFAEAIKDFMGMPKIYKKYRQKGNGRMYSFLKCTGLID